MDFPHRLQFIRERIVIPVIALTLIASMDAPTINLLVLSLLPVVHSLQNYSYPLEYWGDFALGFVTKFQQHGQRGVPPRHSVLGILPNPIP